MTRRDLAARAALLLAASAPGASPPSRDEADVGPLVRALWLIQRRGTPEAADPRNDARTKGALARALGKDGVLTASRIKGLMAPSEFEKLAGPDGRLDPAEVRRAVEADVPEARRRLLPAVAAHADYLSTSFDQVDEPHRAAGEVLSGWIATNHQPGRPLHVIVICTGNSRRSLLGATMGNVAASHYGLPEVRFHSGGTALSAFNPRTIAALRQVGVEIEPTGAEAPRGDPATANPVYRVRWGPVGDPAFEAVEFSKTYSDEANPRDGFAALMVCGEADEGCPFVKGAALRVSMPYLDPKIYDGAYESAKYAERRDDMGRLLMSALMDARRRLAPALA